MVRAGRCFGTSVIALLLAGFSCIASAQGYPDHSIRMVLPFPPGAASDLVGRTIGQQLSKELGQKVVPENRPGASGNIGLSACAHATPDGYTICVSTPGIATSPSLYAHLTYSASDLTPIARLATIENVLLVNPSSPAKTLEQFVALARKHPGKLTFGSGGPGTTNSLANEMLMRNAHIKMLQVAYKGAVKAILALMGGRLDEIVAPVPVALSQIRAGKVRALAVFSKKRVPQLPDVPTTAEAGFKDTDISIWYGMFAPRGTPQQDIAVLHRAIIRALHSKAVLQRYGTLGVEAWPGSAEQLKELVTSETARFAKLIKSIGIKPR